MLKKHHREIAMRGRCIARSIRNIGGNNITESGAAARPSIARIYSEDPSNVITALKTQSMHPSI